MLVKCRDCKEKWKREHAEPPFTQCPCCGYPACGHKHGVADRPAASQGALRVTPEQLFNAINPDETEHVDATVARMKIWRESADRLNAALAASQPPQESTCSKCNSPVEYIETEKVWRHKGHPAQNFLQSFCPDYGYPVKPKTVQPPQGLEWLEALFKRVASDEIWEELAKTFDVRAAMRAALTRGEVACE